MGSARPLAIADWLFGKLVIRSLPQEILGKVTKNLDEEVSSPFSVVGCYKRPDVISAPRGESSLPSFGGKATRLSGPKNQERTLQVLDRWEPK